MSESLSVSLSPIGHWLLLAAVAVLVIALTLWPYRGRMEGSTDRRRWVVLGLRLFALFLCLLAMLRPSLLIEEKVKQRATVAFLIDGSSSMGITDEVNSSSRWDTARRAAEEGKTALKSVAPELEFKSYRFDATVSPDSPDAKTSPQGQQTALGQALLDVVKRESGSRLSAIVLLSDGSNNSGIAPQTAAQNLRAQGVPVVSVGFGSAAGGSGSRDIAVTALDAPETAFVKNVVQVRGALKVRGFPNQELVVELMAEGRAQPVSRTTVRVPASGEVVSVGNLTFTPDRAGETMLTLRVQPREGELIRTNNEYSTFLTVLSGGLNVLHIQGPGTVWEGKFAARSLDAAREIQSELKVVLKPPQPGSTLLTDADFQPGKYDVYILGDIPASFLSTQQQRLLARAVEGGAGLLMLGGRDAFGDGGWGRTPLADVLPVSMRVGDGQLEPPGGLKVVPNTNGLDSYVLQLAPTREENERIWSELPPIPGASRMGQPKPGAFVWAESQGQRPEPIIVAQEGRGRVLAFGGESWPWYRASEIGQAAHRRFWRQAILWLAHKEGGDDRLELKLDRRRVAVGQKLEVSAVARDPNDRAIANATYRGTVQDLDANKRVAPAERSEEQPKAPEPTKTEAATKDSSSEPLELVIEQGEARGAYFPRGEPGVYEVAVDAKDGAKEIGRAKMRFLVYRDDRELENPAANIALLQQVSELTGGAFLRPEQLKKYFAGLDPDLLTQVETQVEYRLWDNWPFLLTFVATLSLEWWMRKRMGWV